MLDLVDMMESNGNEHWYPDEDSEQHLPIELLTEACDLDQLESLEPEPSIIVIDTMEDTTMSNKKVKNRGNKNQKAEGKVTEPATTVLITGKPSDAVLDLVKKSEEKKKAANAPAKIVKPAKGTDAKVGKKVDKKAGNTIVPPGTAERDKKIDELVGKDVKDKVDKHIETVGKGEKDDITKLLDDNTATPPATKPEPVKGKVKDKVETGKSKMGKPSEKSGTNVPASFQNFSKKFVAGKDEVFVPIYEYTHSKLFGSMTAEERETHKKTAIAELGKLLKPGDSVITVVRVVTKSKFTAKCHIFHQQKDGKLVNITRHVKSIESANQDDTDLFMLTPPSSDFASTISKVLFDKKDALTEIRI